MPKDSDRLAGALKKAETGGGALSGFLAEENEFDRRSLWRIGTWAAVAMGAVILAVLANQSQLGWRREQVAAQDLARQAQQIQSLARESQSETRRLASAIDTLNSDRDRLFSRVTVLEQGLDSVTGAVARQNSPVTAAATPPSPQAALSPPSPGAVRGGSQNQAAAPTIAVVTTAPAAMPEKPRAETARPEATVAAAAPSPPAQAITSPPAPVAAPAAPLVASKSTTTPPEPARPEPIVAALPPPAAANPPSTVVSPPAPSVASKSTITPAEPAASKPSESMRTADAAATDGPDATASLPAKAPSEQPEASQASASEVTVQQTEFAVDLGTANSIGGLRALWRGLLKSNTELAALRPIIVVKERNTGLGMQLRLAAGPLKDAAAAAQICATLTEHERTCETTLFDGQRLAMKAEDAQPLPTVKAQKPSSSRHSAARQAKKEEPPPPPKPEPSAFSALFGRH